MERAIATWQVAQVVDAGDGHELAVGRLGLSAPSFLPYPMHSNPSRLCMRLSSAERILGLRAGRTARAVPPEHLHAPAPTARNSGRHDWCAEREVSVSGEVSKEVPFVTASSNGTPRQMVVHTFPHSPRGEASVGRREAFDSVRLGCVQRLNLRGSDTGQFFFRNFRSKPNGSTTCEAHSKELGERMSPERRRRELSTVLLQAQKLASPAEASRRLVLASAINDEDSPQS